MSPLSRTYNSIIVTGSVAYDQLMNFPRQFVEFIQPDKLHQLNVSFIVDQLEKQLGGTATNIAYNTKILTDKKVILLAGLGKDNQDFMKFFQKNDIDTNGVWLDESLYTSTGTGITDIKNNQIWGFYYGAGVRAKNIELATHASKESLLIISANHIDSVIHFQTQAIALGIDYLYDPGMVMTALPKEALLNGVLHSKWFVGNDYEVTQITRMLGVTVEDLLAKGKTVITTLGEKGVWYQTATEQYYVEAWNNKILKDPTGAGDAWRGGFMSGIIEGKPVTECLQQANALASFAVEQFGTVNHAPTPEEIAQRAQKLTITNSYNSSL